MSTHYVGLLSGTSMDAVDSVLISIDPQHKLTCKHFQTYPIPTALIKTLRLISMGESDSLRLAAELDQQLGELFAQATLALLAAVSLAPKDIRAIGSHGQTLLHNVGGEFPYTLQVGDPHIIAARTGIATVADFRRRDVACGGQGAPFGPLIHQQLFHQPLRQRAVLNIGGIANLSLLANASQPSLTGFDTGPGNVLIDAYCQQHLDLAYDHNGELAARGTLDHALIQQWLTDPYFSQATPKSTGTDYFNLAWLNRFSTQLKDNHNSNLANLTELIALSITQALPTAIDELIVCGGGAHNSYLLARLQQHLPTCDVFCSERLGFSPDAVEAILFAWLAHQHVQQQPVDLRTITGAREKNILGAYYAGRIL